MDKKKNRSGRIHATDLTGSPQAKNNAGSGDPAYSMTPRGALRRRAEKIARGKATRMPENMEAMSPEETRRMFHELLVHQIELEMQNEELRRTQAELEASRARYFDLYDLAPVGYVTLSEKGLILQANLTAATLLGVARGVLIKQRLISFILPEDQHSYYHHRKLLFETGAPQVCEMRLVKKDGDQFWARLDATAAQDADGAPVCRTVMIDIAERKRAEEALQRAHDELEQRVAERTEELVRANEALGQSEEKFRNMAEQLVDVLFAADNSAFITFISPSALQMFGWKPEEMVGRNFIEFLTDTEIPGAVAQFKGAMASAQPIQNMPFVMKRKDESTFPGELNSSVTWKDGCITGAIGIIRDITARKRAEEALKESEERYRNQVESVNDVAYAVGREGEITYISPVVKKVLGYEPEEITGRHFLEFVHKVDHDLLKKKFAELREGIVTPEDYRIIGKQGDIKWVRTLTSPIVDSEDFAGGRGILMDITMQKQEEDALRVSEERYRSLASSVDSLYLVDRDCTYLFMNEGCRLRFGVPMEDIIGKRYSDFHSRENSKEFAKTVKEVFETGKPTQFEYQSERDKSILLRTFSPVMDQKEKSISAVTIISKDITERKRLEAQLMQAQKMESLGTLSSGIAHDFNNILASMIGYTELAMMAPDEERRQSDMDQILRACDRATNLVTQILTFSRVTSQEYRPMEMGPIVKEVLKLLRASLPTTIEIRRKITAVPAIIAGNPTQLHQVLMNLCTNAAHAMGENGGILDVRLSPVEVLSEERSPSPGMKAGSYMMLTVSDTGHGIDPAIMDRIFDPFFTTKQAGEGTGLGLSVVYGIAKAHGGEITVQSEPGKGCTFSVYFPTVQASVKPESESLKSLPKGNERILFVDDEADLVRMGRMMLEALGYEVMSFTNSALACRAFISHPDRFDLVITDMTMPVMTGAALSREILKIRPEIPVILCTGYSEFINEKKSKETGIREFLMKPIFVKDLARVIREALDGRTGET